MKKYVYNENLKIMVPWSDEDDKKVMDENTVSDSTVESDTNITTNTTAAAAAPAAVDDKHSVPVTTLDKVSKNKIKPKRQLKDLGPPGIKKKKIKKDNKEIIKQIKKKDSEKVTSHLQTANPIAWVTLESLRKRRKKLN